MEALEIISNLNKLKTGDLLLFHGQHYWFSELIEIATWSLYSHCGLVLKHNERVYLLESGLEYDPQTKKSKLGVQITSLELLLTTYSGLVYIRQLTDAPNLDVPVYNLYLKLRDLPYDTNPFHFLRAYFKMGVGNTRRTDEFFCSALVAYIYSELGLLKSNIDWDIFTPQDISNLKLEMGAKLGSIMFLKSNPNPTLFN